MGHWSETLVEEAAQRIGIDPEANRERLITALEKAGARSRSLRAAGLA